MTRHEQNQSSKPLPIHYSIHRGRHLENAIFVCMTGRTRFCSTIEMVECEFAEIIVDVHNNPSWENRFYVWISRKRMEELEDKQ